MDCSLLSLVFNSQTAREVHSLASVPADPNTLLQSKAAFAMLMHTAAHKAYTYLGLITVY